MLLIDVVREAFLTVQYASIAGKTRTAVRIKAGEALAAGDIARDEYEKLLGQDLVWKQSNEVSAL
jgi:hypothetical protein